MFTGEKREKRARQGGRAKSPQGYPPIPRGLFASPTKPGEDYRAPQRRDTNVLINKRVKLAPSGSINAFLEFQKEKREHEERSNEAILAKRRHLEDFIARNKARA